jgi:DNA-binding response OmpR family regulator
MIKILLVDDEPTNSKILEFHIRNYLIEHGMNNFVIDDATNGYEAFGMHYFNSYDILMLDVKMPKYDGIRLLNNIRKIKEIKQPEIYMVTSFGDEKYKSLFKIKGADTCIVKPFDKDIIYSVLSKIFNNEVQQTDVEEDFFDFDDFDNADEKTLSKKDSLEKYNKTHLKVSAQEFLKDVDNLSYIIEDFNEIEDDILKTIDNLTGDTLQLNINIISESINTYASMLNGFSEFYELSIALRTLNRLLLKTDFTNNMVESKREIIANFIKAILNDLVDWLENVFIKQDALDVFYINASVLSSCMQLEMMIQDAYNH